ncbi:MAG: hypothetical protein OEW87_05185 [Flavobacteriaceae bacterium]|nr:hypothetical protein [Flavobacteriaceae bacterium]
MNPLETSRGSDGKGDIKYDYTYTTGGEVIPSFRKGILEDTTKKTLEGESEHIYITERVTGEPSLKPSAAIEKVKEILKEAIKLIEEVLEVFEFDIIESINKFSLFEEQIKLIWENREETNEYFRDVIVHLLAAAHNSQYQKYNKNQFQSFKLILENIQDINIDKSHVRESLKIFRTNKIDLFAPIRNWGNYRIEIKKG